MVGAPRGRSRGVTPHMPLVALEGDTPDRVMAVNGALLGFSRARAVWCFGFKPGTLLAGSFHVFTVRPLRALAFHDGHVIETYFGPWDAQLPSRFVNILEAVL
jgi:hypothetical protein